MEALGELFLYNEAVSVWLTYFNKMKAQRNSIAVYHGLNSEKKKVFKQKNKGRNRYTVTMNISEL